MQDFAVQKIIQKLVDWFQTNQQFYSFRFNRTPYTTWISEVCLQQTKLEVAISKITSFLELFPDLLSLAAADEKEVLHAFSGLGYYNRARNIHKGAKYIINRFEGVFPNTYRLLCTIPSIGPYTAGAIASLCFGQLVPAIDTNVKRIVHRVFNSYYLPLSSTLTKNQVEFICEDLMSRIVVPPGHWNEVLMQFGQKVCLKSNPHCITCPLSSMCLFYQQKQIGFLKDYKNIRTIKRIEARWEVGILHSSDNQILLHKLDNFPLLNSHWGFPSLLTIDGNIYGTNIMDNIKSDVNKQRLFNIWKKKISIKQESSIEKEWVLINKLKHSITKYNITVYIYLLNIPFLAKIEQNASNFLKWCMLNEVEEYLVSSLFLKCLSSYQKYLSARGGI